MRLSMPSICCVSRVLRNMNVCTVELSLMIKICSNVKQLSVLRSKIDFELWICSKLVIHPSCQIPSNF